MAIDFRKNNRDDRFLSNIRKYNYNWYPSGYTGYEQYYTDMEGFWRQLYNPDYDGSYAAWHMTQKLFDENKGKIYKSVPNYVNCKEGQAFHRDLAYYQKSEAGEFEEVELTKLNFRGKEENYYYIPSANPFNIEKCSDDESYDSSIHYYRRIADEFETTNEDKSKNYWKKIYLNTQNY